MTKKIGNIVSTIVMIILLALVAILYVPKLFGITPMVVLSGSMEPTYHVGSLIFVDKTSPEKLEVGDKVTFNFENTKTMVTHRIVEKNEDEKFFITKGDNNNSRDGGNLSYNNVIGKAKDFSIPFLGYIAKYLNTSFGFICLITVAIAVLLITILFDGKSKKKEGAN